MASQPSNDQHGGVGAVLAALIASDGSGAHPYVGSDTLLAGERAAHNLADAAHFLCMLHGRYPGVVDHAMQRIVQPLSRRFIYRVAPGFAAERAYLTRLVVAAGPLPSTLGQAQSEAAVTGQTHALATLAQSERNGTAMGAALALVLDWRAVRQQLDAAAQRFGIPQPPLDLPGVAETLDVASQAGESPAVERAITFGAQQLLLQHRGLWDLLAAREGARHRG